MPHDLPPSHPDSPRSGDNDSPPRPPRPPHPPPTAAGRALFLVSALVPYLIVAVGFASASGRRGFDGIGVVVLALIAAGGVGVAVLVSGILVVRRHWTAGAWRWIMLAAALLGGLLPSLLLIYIASLIYLGR